MTEGHAAHARQFERLANAPLDLGSPPGELVEALARVVPFDTFGWAAVDPTSLLSTRGIDTSIPGPQLWELQEVVARGLEPRDIGALRRSGRHVARLSDVVKDGEESPVHRRFMRPNGLEHQLRAALVVDGTQWGLLHIDRGPTCPDFTSSEVSLIEALVPHLGHAFRRWLLSDPSHTTETRPPAVPGVIVLDEDNEVDSISPEAEHWLSEWGLSNLHSPPRAVAAVVAAARARARAHGHTEQLPSARLRLPTGTWLHVHATHLTHPDRKPRTAVVLERAAADHVAPLIARANQLTVRESEIATRVLRGLSTGEIAAELFISPYTVQDHLKSIFEKLGVRSRRELATEIFEPHYQPA